MKLARKNITLKVVPGLIPAGPVVLTVLTGKPKIGKSWFAQALAKKRRVR